MTIEFHCPYCQKVLKTADDRAGVRANCPGCGESIVVPEPGQEETQADPSLVVVEDAGEAVPAGPKGGESARGADEGRASETRACPMCGASIKAAATRCRFCGESFVVHPSVAPAPIEAGEVLSRTWQIFQQKFGLLVGSTLILLGIAVAMFIVMYLVQIVLMFAVLPGAAGPGGRPNVVALVAAIYGPMFAFLLLFLVVSSFLEGGYHVLFCRLVRGEQAEIGDLFAGGRYFWRIFAANLVFFAAIYAGLLLVVVPGIFVALAFWPFMYVIVDRDMGVIEAFRRSRELTSGNYLAILVLALAAFGVNMLGSLACYVGLIFTTPFANLLFAVAYCMLTGQIAPRPRRAV